MAQTPVRKLKAQVKMQWTSECRQARPIAMASSGMAVWVAVCPGKGILVPVSRELTVLISPNIGKKKRLSGKKDSQESSASFSIAVKDLKDPALPCRRLAASSFWVILQWGI